MAGNAMMPLTEERMACEDNVDLFNAAIDRPNDHDVVDAARRLCHGCPVRVSCYRHGRDTGSTGVFGGIYLEPKLYTPSGVCGAATTSPETTADPTKDASCAVSANATRPRSEQQRDRR